MKRLYALIVVFACFVADAANVSFNDFDTNQIHANAFGPQPRVSIFSLAGTNLDLVYGINMVAITNGHQIVISSTGGQATNTIDVGALTNILVFTNGLQRLIAASTDTNVINILLYDPHMDGLYVTNGITNGILQVVGGVVWADQYGMLSNIPPQVANTIYAGPVNGADAQPTFRPLVIRDFPTGVATYDIPNAFTKPNYFNAITVTNGITNISLTANTVLKSDANKATASIPNSAGALTNSGGGVLGYYNAFVALDANNIFTGSNLFNGKLTVSSNLLVTGNIVSTGTNTWTGTQHVGTLEATNAHIVTLDVNTGYITNLTASATYALDYVFPMQSGPPSASVVGGSVGVSTNHEVRNVNGKLWDYWSDGATLWSAILSSGTNSNTNGVTTFNTRVGDVTLNSNDVISALGYSITDLTNNFDTIADVNAKTNLLDTIVDVDAKILNATNQLAIATTNRIQEYILAATNTLGTDLRQERIDSTNQLAIAMTNRIQVYILAATNSIAQQIVDATNGLLNANFATNAPTGVRIADTNLVTTTKAGLTPKLPNDATKYLDGTGNYTVPSTISGGVTTFNTRAGDVVLNSNDVVSALGYSITGLTNNFDTIVDVNAKTNLLDTIVDVNSKITGAATNTVLISGLNTPVTKLNTSTGMVFSINVDNPVFTTATASTNYSQYGWITNGFFESIQATNEHIVYLTADNANISGIGAPFIAQMNGFGTNTTLASCVLVGPTYFVNSNGVISLTLISNTIPVSGFDPTNGGWWSVEQPWLTNTALLPTITSLLTNNNVWTGSNTFNGGLYISTLNIGTANLTNIHGLITTGNVTNEAGSAVAYMADFAVLTNTSLYFPTNPYPIVGGTALQLDKNTQFCITNNTVNITGFTAISNNMVSWSRLGVSNSAAGAITIQWPATVAIIGGTNTANSVSLPSGKRWYGTFTVDPLGTNLTAAAQVN